LQISNRVYQKNNKKAINSQRSLSYLSNKKPPQLKGGFRKKREWLDDFRTFEWEKAFPTPEVTIKEINQLLALV
jgi:hypothetical protein